MTKVLVGHRGVGKTTLLNRLRDYFPNLRMGDLDQIIEVQTGQSIASIFATQGEAEFRKLEISTLESVVDNFDYLVLGAGFQLQSLPPNLEVIWVRRPTDSLGRIFTNRPRLNSQLSALDEYQERFQAREELYESKANWDYQMPEGRVEPSIIEKSIFDRSLDLSDVIYTLPKRFEHYLDYILGSNLKEIELRDDILSQEQILSLIQQIPDEKILVSFRSGEKSRNLLRELRGLGRVFEMDWALENGSAHKEASILSLHERVDQKSLDSSLQRLISSSIKGQHLKLAVEVKNFEELKQGIVWQKADPENRSFLPRSGDGRWAWARLFLKGKQKINFIKIMGGSALDQPSPYQWLATPSSPLRFAAVLGDPVFHSWSPETHRKFFASKQIPFWAIRVQEAEWDEAISVLKEIGLVAAAVTSPLKIKAGEVNTLWYDGCKWQKANTDQQGLEALLESVSRSASCVIWGGGGTLSVLEKALPQAKMFSVRTGKSRTLDDSEISSDPEVVVWAASPEAELPPAQFRPIVVVDLNYREDSRAREFAQVVGAKYISGESMFFAQAHAQQQLWGPGID